MVSIEKPFPVEIRTATFEPLESINITFKAVVLKSQGTEPEKILCGIHFSPKDYLSPEAKKAVEEMIRQGKHLEKFYDFPSGKISNEYSLINLIEVLGWTSGKYSMVKNLTEFTPFRTKCLKAFEKGWREGVRG